MTVQELIDRLKTYPPNLPVMVDGYEGGCDYLDANDIRQNKVKLNANCHGSYCGLHEELREYRYGCDDCPHELGVCPAFNTDAVILSRTDL